MKTITLSNLHEATEQEIFDQVSKHLLTQNSRAVLNLDICRYRGGNNSKCAGGCLMSDKEYKPGFENQSWYQLVLRKQIPVYNHIFISKLQTIHDSIPVEQWKEKLQELAIDNSLMFNN